jgi:3-phosphoshikimate 1-carboxyvinyltransferase
VPPPDKSISHRAAIVGAMCEGEVRIANFLRAADTQSTLDAVTQLGAEVVSQQTHGSHADLVLRGVGLGGAGGGPRDIDVGNAGTLLRILPGWLAGQGSGRWTLDGDESIRGRPVDRVADPLRAMGARLECRDGRFPPLVVQGARLRGVEYELPVASAQVKSCLLLAGLLADGQTTVVEPIATRDHTERMLATAGAPFERRGDRLVVGGTRQLALDEIDVPGDFSSAAFFVVAAALVPGSELRVRDVGVNPTRIGLLRVMERMGVPPSVEGRRFVQAEPIADVVVRPGGLRGTTVGAKEVPLLIDELPLVALLGAFAQGTTIVEGAEELRHKESDRIAMVVHGLRGLGARIEARSDGFEIEGSGGLEGGELDAAGDHRLAMLGAVAGMASRGGVEVKGFEAAAVSYPGFEDDLAGITAD